MKIETKFNIGDSVYHATPDSNRGIVLDCIYSLRNKEWTYLVAFGGDMESLVYYEEELTDTKIFN